MSFYTLPREAIDAIIQNLDGDRSALAACSLTGWLLLPSCRYEAFSTMTVDVSELQGLLELVDTPHSTVASMIRFLRITGKDSADGDGDGKDYNEKKGCCRFVQARGGWISSEAIRLLQGVRYVGLSGLSRVPALVWEFLRELKGIRVVEVERLGFESVVPFVEWVDALPKLEEISVIKSAWDLTEPGLEGILERWDRQKDDVVRLRIPVLDIDDWAQVGVVQWLMAQKHVPAVRSLRIGSKMFSDGGWGTELLKRFIEVVGPSIEHLHVVIQDDMDGTDGSGALDFSPCTNIRSVRFEGSRIGPSHRMKAGAALEKVLDIILAACGRHLQKVALVFDIEPQTRGIFGFYGIPDTALFERFDWGRIPEIVGKGWAGRESRSCDGQTELALIIQGSAGYRREQVEEVLRKGVFRTIAAQGVLRVLSEGPFCNNIGDSRNV